MAFQGSLLDLAAEPAVGALGPSVRRVPLDHGAWLDLRPGWISGADALFEALLPSGGRLPGVSSSDVRSGRTGRPSRTPQGCVSPGGTTPRDPPERRRLGPDRPAVADIAWRAERRWMYDRVVDVPRLVCYYGEGEELPHPVLEQARAALNRRYRAELGEPLCTAGLCLYRDGRDSVAWHGDISGRHADRTVVAIVSLGDPRTFLLRSRPGRGPALRYELGHGDLLVMGGTCQRTWQHAIPKTARAAGPRISVQFRPRGIR